MKISGRRWNSYLTLILTISFCVMLIEGSYLLTSSMTKTIARNRIITFGEWHYANSGIEPSDITCLRSNPLFESTGVICTQNEIYDGEGRNISLYGTMDANALSLCRIQFYEGAFPKQENEVVIEKALLQKLEFVENIGDNFSLSWKDAKGDWQKKTFYLVGIIENYDVNTDLEDKMDLPGIIGMEQAEMDKRDYTLLVKGVDSWNTMEEDLAELSLSGRWLENKSAYPKDVRGSMDVAMDKLRQILFEGSLLIIAAVVFSRWKKTEEDWKTRFLLGADLSYYRYSLLREAMGITFVSSVIGMAGAILIYTVSIYWFRLNLQMELVWGVAWVDLFMGILDAFIFVVIAYGYPILMGRRWLDMDQRKRGGENDPSSSPVKRRNHQIRQEKLTWIKILCREFVLSMRYRLVCLLLVCLIILTYSMGIYYVRDKWKVLEGVRNNYGDSYYIEHYGETPYTSKSAQGIQKRKIHDAEDVYGIDHIEAVYRFSYMDFTLLGDLNELANDSYYELYKEEILGNLDIQRHNYEDDPTLNDNVREDLLAGLDQKEKLLDECGCPLSIWGIDEGMFLDRMLRNIDQGEVDREAFLQGEEAILMLPAVAEMCDEYGAYYVTEWKGDSTKNMIYSTAEPGFELTLWHDGQNENVHVTAIISSVSEDDQCQPMPYGRYTLLVSKKFLEKYDFVANSGVCQIVCVGTNQNADYFTDKKISKLAFGDNMEWVNSRELMENAKNELYETSGFWVILSTFIIGISLLTYKKIKVYEFNCRKEKWKTWMFLGVPERFLYLDSMAGTILIWSLSSLLVTLALSVYYTAMANDIIADLGRRLSLNLRVGYEKSLYFGLLFLVLVLMSVIEVRFAQRTMKEVGEYYDRV